MKGYIWLGVLSLIGITSALFVYEQKSTNVAPKIEVAGEAESPAFLREQLNYAPRKTLTGPKEESFLASPPKRSLAGAYSHRLLELHKVHDIPYFKSPRQNLDHLTHARADVVLANQYRRHFMSYTSTSKLIRLAKDLGVNSAEIEYLQSSHRQQLVDNDSRALFEKKSNLESNGVNSEQLSKQARQSFDSQRVKQTMFYHKNRLVNSIVVVLLDRR